MVKAKSKFAKISLCELFIDTQPNVDYFTREELKALVKQFKDDVNKGKLNDVSSLVIIEFNLVNKKQRARHINSKIVR